MAGNRVAGSRAGTIFLLFGLWSLGLTYPLALHPVSRIPLGSEPAATVPFFNLWTLQWNIDQLMLGYPRYWDASIFAPLSGTFAFSETQPLSALLAAPVWLAGQHPALAYNFVLLLFITLNGWFAFWLLRTWGVAAWPAFLAGLLTQSLPFVAQEMGVLQLVALFGLLWPLLFLSRFLREDGRGRPTWPTGLALALGPPAAFFTCGYYGLFGLIFWPAAFLAQLRPAHVNIKTAGQLAAIGLLALGLTAPFLWAQQHRLVNNGLSRSQTTIKNNSAQPADYVHFLDTNVLYGQWLGLPAGTGQRLFPGMGLAALAAVGLWGRRARRVKLYLAAGVLLALLLSLGLRFEAGGIAPYRWLQQTVPGYTHLRSPFRFAAVVQLHLALLAGFGLHNLAGWLPRASKTAAALLATLAMVEALALPLPLTAAPVYNQPLAWATWLNRQPLPRRIVILPFAPGSKAADFEPTTRWMLHLRGFEGDMLNGYSGFFPADHARLRQVLADFPSPAGVGLLRAMGVQCVVAHHRLPGMAGDVWRAAYQEDVAGVSVYCFR